MVLHKLPVGLMVWALRLFHNAGTNIPTHQPTTAIVASGPYRVSRNPIYVSMVLGLLGLGIILDNLVPGTDEERGLAAMTPMTHDATEAGHD